MVSTYNSYKHNEDCFAEINIEKCSMKFLLYYAHKEFNAYIIELGGVNYNIDHFNTLAPFFINKPIFIKLIVPVPVDNTYFEGGYYPIFMPINDLANNSMTDVQNTLNKYCDIQRGRVVNIKYIQFDNIIDPLLAAIKIANLDIDIINDPRSSNTWPMLFSYKMFITKDVQVVLKHKDINPNINLSNTTNINENIPYATKIIILTNDKLKIRNKVFYNFTSTEIKLLRAYPNKYSDCISFYDIYNKYSGHVIKKIK